MNLFKRNPKLTTEEKDKLSAQQMIPFKALDSGAILTPDNRLVMILKVDAINTELLSDSELDTVFEKYESFLKLIKNDVSTSIVSQPIDLKKYVQKEKERLNNTKNFYRKKLLNDYIDYCNGMQQNKGMVQRKRYFIFDEKIKGPDKFHQTIEELEEKAASFIQGFKEMDLESEPLTNLETIQYFHIFFDFEGAQLTPILEANIPQIIIGGHENDNEIQYELAAEI
ncbi:hypothetical protein OCO53_25555 [Peribacillus frigoritolerans]|uniref:hypothetical protein n=1 Tax=Peribacillus frigoritolerans TaxID=450367 RepID=UPI0021D21003|nr:hypothetical protein [Peribacillus frigoritolerans]MCU6603810.1 hypothetical protein [Peribacillus frigoritolerans]